jgi:hypothetical protein
MSRWFRHYAGLCRDEKLVGVAIKSRQPVERVVWIWAAILESAAELDDGGRYELDHGEIGYFLRAEEADIASIETALSAAGRVDAGCVSKWKDRQFQADRTGGKTRGSETYVYFIGADWGSAVKIGFSRNPWSRVLEFQTGSPTKLSVLAAFKTSTNSEIDIHTLLAGYRRSGEWFELPQAAMLVIENAATGKKSTYEDLLVTLRSVLRSATNTETETEVPVANATGPVQQTEKPALSPADQLWTDGIATLETMHVAAPKARSMVGKWLKDTGGDAGRVHWAIGEASIHGTGDPIPYIARVLSDRSTTPRGPPFRQAKRNTGLEGLQEIVERTQGNEHQQTLRIAG